MTLDKIINWGSYYVTKKAKVGEWGKYDMLDIDKFKKKKKQVCAINAITTLSAAMIGSVVAHNLGKK
ncbi:MAG: hypothetical protein LIO74_05125 [Ruminococcus sp.]|nr:hypothetical protein [Ruminococcus sp.]